MKEIKCKTKFAVISIYKEKSYIATDENPYELFTNEQMNDSLYLSEITEEQAAEFIEEYGWMYRGYNGEHSPFPYKTAKESLISLLKANDVWIKEWCNYKDFDVKSFDDEMDMHDQIQYQDNCPDDLLLIKL